MHELDQEQQRQRRRQDLPDSRDRCALPGRQQIDLGLDLGLELLVRDCRFLGLVQSLGDFDAGLRFGFGSEVLERGLVDQILIDFDDSGFLGCVLDVVDLDPFLDRLLADPRLAARAVGETIEAADLDVPAFERDVLLRGGLVDFDPLRGCCRRACRALILLLPVRCGSGGCRRGPGWR